MKKTLCLLFAFFTIALSASAMDFNEGFAQCSKKPMILLIYADWASGYQANQKVFNELKSELSDKYNFVELNIANPEAAGYNSKYSIYPNLPYIMAFRNAGKITRYIPNPCASDKACIKNKLKTYMN